MQNATNGQEKQIGQLEQQLQDKRLKITKLKEYIKKLHTLSSPPILPSIENPMIISSTDDEQ